MRTRWETWLTLRGLLFRPAFLPSEYCAGRRRRYVNPFRLLITAAIAYALANRGGVQVGMFIGPVNVSLASAAVSEGTSITATVERIDRFHLLWNLLAEREKSPGIESEAVRDKFHRQVERFAESLSFANVLLLAVALYGLFGRRRTHFVEHGGFSMHFMSFVLFTALLFALVLPLIRAGWSTAVLPDRRRRGLAVHLPRRGSPPVLLRNTHQGYSAEVGRGLRCRGIFPELGVHYVRSDPRRGTGSLGYVP